MSEETKEEKLYDRLKGEIDQASWDLLDQHHERGAVFTVSKDLELIAVAYAMARDEVEYFRDWLGQGKIFQPEEHSIATWKEQETKFDYIIIQPYVLIQVHGDDLQ